MSAKGRVASRLQSAWNLLDRHRDDVPSARRAAWLRAFLRGDSRHDIAARHGVTTELVEDAIRYEMVRLDAQRALSRRRP